MKKYLNPIYGKILSDSYYCNNVYNLSKNFPNSPSDSLVEYINKIYNLDNKLENTPLILKDEFVDVKQVFNPIHQKPTKHFLSISPKI